MTTNEHIDQFISRQTVASVCCTDAAGSPWCFSCYYSFEPHDHLLYFKSDLNTKHLGMLLQDNRVAGTIVPDKISKLQVRGIQFEGEWLAADDPEAAGASKHYHQKYPFALAMPGTVYAIRLNFLKMTDSTLGFGTKLLWHRHYHGHLPS